jgi:hypothetical protein
MYRITPVILNKKLIISTVQHSTNTLLNPLWPWVNYKKRVTISDYPLVDYPFEISNISFTPKDLIDTHHIMTLIIKE